MTKLALVTEADRAAFINTAYDRVRELEHEFGDLEAMAGIAFHVADDVVCHTEFDPDGEVTEHNLTPKTVDKVMFAIADVSHRVKALREKYLAALEGRPAP